MSIANAVAQTAQTDTSIASLSKKNITAYFNKQIGPQSMLYNGREFNYYDRTIVGNAGFKDVFTWTDGSIDYEDYTYANIPLIYDIVGDKLATLLPNHFTTFYFVEERVKDFTISGHYFIHLGDSLTGIKQGYYEQAYSGKSQVLIKWSKSIQVSTMVNGYQTYFVESHSYFIRKGNIYYEVGSEGAIEDVFKDRKKEITQFIKTNKLRFRKDPIETMSKVTAYYDQISN